MCLPNIKCNKNWKKILYDYQKKWLWMKKYNLQWGKESHFIFKKKSMTKKKLLIGILTWCDPKSKQVN